MTGPVEVYEEGEWAYSPTRISGFVHFAEGPVRTMPQRLARGELGRLSPAGREEYDEARAVWHANLGPIKTPQLLGLHEQLAEIVEANRQDGDKAKPAALVDAYPGLGKTTAVLAYVREFHLRQIRLRGEITAEGHRRVPVLYIALTGNTLIRGLNAGICRFYGLPVRGDADQLAERAKDACLSLRTRVFVIDDIHFLAPSRADTHAVRMANHLKFLSNAFPVTMIYIGVGVRRRGILNEGHDGEQALLAQFARRTTALSLRPFAIDDDPGRVEWRRLLLSIERQLVLAERFPGMLADELSDYLFARTAGHFASLMALVGRGCLRAIRTGAERLDAALMDQVANDAAADAGRLELLAAIEAGLITSRPAARSRPGRES